MLSNKTTNNQSSQCMLRVMLSKKTADNHTSQSMLKPMLSEKRAVPVLRFPAFCGMPVLSLLPLLCLASPKLPGMFLWSYSKINSFDHRGKGHRDHCHHWGKRSPRPLSPPGEKVTEIIVTTGGKSHRDQCHHRGTKSPRNHCPPNRFLC